MEFRTARLRLEPLTAAHRTHAIALFQDHRTWAHLAGSPADAASTAASFIALAERSRSETGLGIWAAFLRDDVTDGPPVPGGFIGIGGVRTTATGPWNLGLSIVPAAWGRGHASEIAQAAVAAATAVAPDRPVTARALAANVGSERALTRAGLRSVWEGPSTETPGATARIYTTAPLSEVSLAWLVEHS